jgi:peptidoglycan/LPS O-acetylase OafA/YrhL
MQIRRHENCFDHVRLAAAISVFVSHQYGFTLAESSIPYIGLIGSWGVNVFFAVAGYLNTASLLSSRSVLAFFNSRAFRIYPALIFSTVATVLVGALLTNYSLAEYFTGQTFDYLW